MRRADTAKRLFRLIAGKNKGAIVFVLVLIVVSALANVAGSMFIRQLIDDYIEPLILSSSRDFSGLLYALLVVGAIYVVGVISTLIYSRMMVGVAQSTLKKIRDDMFAHMQTLPIKFYDTHKHGDLMSRFTNDAETLREFISMGLPQIISSAVTVVSIAVAMLTINLILSAFVFLCGVVMIVLSRKLGGKAAVNFIAQQKSLGTLNGYIAEMMNGQKVIKVFCHEEAVKADFDCRNRELKEYAVKANSLTNILMPLMLQIGTIQYALIALLGGVMALYGFGGITLGVIAAFLILAKAFSGPIGQISAQVNIVITAFAGAGRIFNIMDEPKEEDNGYVTLVNARVENGAIVECAENTGLWAWKHPHGDGTLTYTPVAGNVSFNDVDFAYVPEKPVLHGIVLDVKAGQKIAFVGATGAGKTTITNLLNRFYDIADGKIRYDGININKIKKDSLRKSLGIVLQDTNLFSGTIADNIRYGRLDATREEIQAAAVLANAHDFIMRMPDGYDTFISADGASLSGGQRQLIAIARAAVADPPVMILDEATSSIDIRTEALVQKGMDGLMRGRTVFVIAHRLSTVKNSDMIAVLEQGSVIECGNHETLISKKGRYYQLYTGSYIS